MFQADDLAPYGSHRLVRAALYLADPICQEWILSIDVSPDALGPLGFVPTRKVTRDDGLIVADHHAYEVVRSACPGLPPGHPRFSGVARKRCSR